MLETLAASSALRMRGFDGLCMATPDKGVMASQEEWMP